LTRRPLDPDVLVAADTKFTLFLEAVLRRATPQQLADFRNLLTDIANTHPPDQAALVRSWLSPLGGFETTGSGR